MDPATFLPTVWGPYFPLRTACLFSNGNIKKKKEKNQISSPKRFAQQYKYSAWTINMWPIIISYNILMYTLIAVSVILLLRITTVCWTVLHCWVQHQCCSLIAIGFSSWIASFCLYLDLFYFCFIYLNNLLFISSLFISSHFCLCAVVIPEGLFFPSFLFMH